MVYRVISEKGLTLKHRAAEELWKHSGELTEEMAMAQFGPGDQDGRCFLRAIER